MIDHVGVIKIDVEGSELAAFQGAHNLLSKSHPVLLVEFHAIVARQASWELVELYDLLKGYGYTAHEFNRNELVPFDQSRLSNPEFYANLIFKKD
jgi:hypothetical protein